MNARAFSPKTIAKAARLVVVRRNDGRYDVAGDSGTYRVSILSSSAGTERTSCDCQAGRCGNHCSHILAVRLQRGGSLTPPERVCAGASHQKAEIPCP